VYRAQEILRLYYELGLSDRETGSTGATDRYFLRGERPSGDPRMRTVTWANENSQLPLRNVVSQ